MVRIGLPFAHTDRSTSFGVLDFYESAWDAWGRVKHDHDVLGADNHARRLRALYFVIHDTVGPHRAALPLLDGTWAVYTHEIGHR